MTDDKRPPCRAQLALSDVGEFVVCPSCWGTGAIKLGGLWVCCKRCNGSGEVRDVDDPETWDEELP